MKDLEKNKAYKVLEINPTMHETYGAGQRMTLVNRSKQKCRSQIPGKYLSGLTDEGIEFLIKDIAKGKNPFIVFREIMNDNSYKIDLIDSGK